LAENLRVGDLVIAPTLSEIIILPQVNLFAQALAGAKIREKSGCVSYRIGRFTCVLFNLIIRRWANNDKHVVWKVTFPVEGGHEMVQCDRHGAGVRQRHDNFACAGVRRIGRIAQNNLQRFCGKCGCRYRHRKRE
jgi:hypothetical protein